VNFDVWLGEQKVGVLVREEATSIISFVLDERYASMPDRPVLGQQFEERVAHRVFRQAAHPGTLPAFFANLLPEGALEAMVTAQFSPADDVARLAIVGEDLPGAVIVRAASAGVTLPVDARAFDEPVLIPVNGNEALRFSLAGVQLKFSAVEKQDQRFTLPFRGMGGRWIMKFGSEAYPRLPENEHATMAWAAQSGISVPTHRLVATRDIEGIDERFLALGERVFAVERYDRTEGGGRIHQEDFAQVRGVPPKPSSRKYGGASMEGLARFIGDLCGFEDQQEFLRRTLFLIICGNTDGHLKNWSLVYPDRREARLSPAYDLVCVRQYLPEDKLALPLANERVLERIGWEHVARVQKYLSRFGFESKFEELGREFVARALDVWAQLRPEVESQYAAVVDRHLSRLPLIAAL
jgi:serine/threonine-protein kinase HipA